MKWIGQHIWSFISRFRSDVYLEATETGTIASGGNLGLDSNNKIVKAASGSGDLTITNASDNRIVTSTGGTGLNAEEYLSWDGDSLLASSSTAGKPIFTLANSHSNAVGPSILFQKTDTNGTDNDQLGFLNFFGHNDNNQDISFAKIHGKISDATDGEEAGKIELQVAEYDGTLTTGLLVDGDTDADGEVDVTIGAGAASLTTIAGTLTMGSTAFVNNSGVIQVATQGTIDHDSLANFVAAEHYRWDTDISSTATIHTNNITDLHGAGVDGSANQLLTDDGDGSVTSEAGFTWDGDDLIIGSATSQKPVVELKNTNTNGHGPELKLSNTKGGSTDGVDGDYAGKITFHAVDDGTPTAQQYGEIGVRADDVTSTEESGSMFFSVASHDGGMNIGLTMVGGDVDSEVDVAIGNGTGSTTTVAGMTELTSGATILGNNYLIFNNASDNRYTRVNSSTSLTNRTITLPDATGTVALTSDITSDGWHGSTTRIKILPRDFVANDGGRPVMIEDDSVGSNELFLFSFSSFDMFAYVPIPTGYKATAVRIYGSDSGQNFYVYKGGINTKTITDVGTGAHAIDSGSGSENSLATEVTSDTTNYLIVRVTSDGATDEVHGGYVTIAAV